MTDLSTSEKPAGLSREDFDVLARNGTANFRALSDADRARVHSLRLRLLRYAEGFCRDLGSTVPLTAFASHPSPNGRLSRAYWSCAFPAAVANKSFAFQLWVIVTAETVEIGFGAGAGSSAFMRTTPPELVAALQSARARLNDVAGTPTTSKIGAWATSAGYTFRQQWARDPAAPGFGTIGEWITHAASDQGGGAAISRFLARDDAIALGNELFGAVRDELRHFIPIMEAVYSMPDDWDLRPGEAIKRSELHDRYGGGRQGGIAPSNKTPNVLIFSDHASGDQHGYVYDGWADDRHDVFLYTGEGRTGDQELAGGNRAIAEHVKDGRALRLFDGARGTVVYVGEFTVDPEYPYERRNAPPTGGGVDRKVLVFRLLAPGAISRVAAGRLWEGWEYELLFLTFPPTTSKPERQRLAHLAERLGRTPEAIEVAWLAGEEFIRRGHSPLASKLLAEYLGRSGWRAETGVAE